MAQITLSDVFAQKHNPYPYYAQLREQGPLSRCTWLGMELWLATSYDDTFAILKDPRFVVNPPQAKPAASGGKASRYMPLAWSRHLLNTDALDHTRLRTLVSKAFTPRMIEQLRPRIQEMTDSLLDRVQSQGKMDLMADFASPLPIMVILEMLGIPGEDRQQFRTWTQIIVASQGGVSGSEEAGRAAEEAFLSYLKTLIARKRAQGGTDLVCELARVEEEGDTLSEDELISMVFLLITAGHETTVNLIANGMLALLEHPDQMSLLHATPELLPSAIEELLRYTAPVSLSVPRWASEDVALHDQVIRKGEIVRCALLAANTDPQQCADPEALNILRQEQKHLAFGKGVHFCLGAPLARLEGQIAVGTLLSCFPNMHLACEPEHLTWQDAGSLRVLAALPVTF